MPFNIQEGYLDNNSVPLQKGFSDNFGSGTAAIDELLASPEILTES